MTTPSVPPITTDHVMTELRTTNPGRAYPISVTDTDVRTLAGIPSGPISLLNLLGKTSGGGGGGGGGGGSMLVSSTDGSKNVSSVGAGGTATANPSVSASGGVAPYSYLWTLTSNPNGCSLGSSTSATCAVSKSYTINSNGDASAILQCVVTDSTPGTPLTITRTGIQSNISWSNGA